MNTGLLVDLLYGLMWYGLLNRNAPLDDTSADRLAENIPILIHR